MKKALNLIIKLSALALCGALIIGGFLLVDQKGKTPAPDGPINDGGSIPAGSDAQLGEIVSVSEHYSYDEMVEDISLLAEKYAGKLSYEIIGGSLDGRSIYAVRLGSPDAKKQIVITAGIHAREYMTSLLVMRQIEYYLAGYDTESYGGVPFSEIFSEYSFCIIPMCNPDGASISQLGLSGVSSTELRGQILEIYEKDKAAGFTTASLDEYLRSWKANARGVDLNRNFDTEDFGVLPKISRPSFMNYHGKSALSEPESRAMVEYVDRLENPVMSLAIHSQGEVIYFNSGQENYDESYALSKKVGDFLGYYVHTSVRRDSAFDDRCNKNMAIPSLTVEVGKGISPLPIGDFDKIWSDNRDLWLFAALYHRESQQ